MRQYIDTEAEAPTRVGLRDVLVLRRLHILEHAAYTNVRVCA
jgi:hypothetical protein